MLVLLWQPAITVAELAPQQNVIAVVLDDSRSMAIADSGSDGKLTREAAAQKALEDGVLAGLQKKFQTRLYRLDSRVAQAAALKDIQPAAPATHINDGLRQLASETSDLPIGAIVLLSDGSENSLDGSGDLSLETINALRNRRLPVHTVGFGKEQARARCGVERRKGRLPRHGRFAHPGYGYPSSNEATRAVRRCWSFGMETRPLGSREITLGADGATQVETIFFSPGDAGVKSLHFLARPAGR